MPPQWRHSTNPATLAALLLKLFTPAINENGSVRFTHVSGSAVEFAANGNIHLLPAQDMVIDPGRFMRVQTSEAEIEEWYRRRLLQTLYAAMWHKLPPEVVHGSPAGR